MGSYRNLKDALRNRNVSWDCLLFDALTNVPVQATSKPSLFGGYQLYNPNSIAVYVQLFDVNATPTVGTTVPDLSLAFPPQTAANFESNYGTYFERGIWMAITTTPKGATNPTTPITMNLFYKSSN